ncbi:hypothetical protein ADK76_19920 [Streptomyces griseoflavus]|uniref:universal stress protein n=1 Tax=Streptomyces rimosus TaxID=1927 RepID=UPI0004C58CF4|nr:universal stress protein [Streptomyces rimosus]KOG56296.1 hypothetical protein ADK76_19920 [Streptomyces griseoflavus]
MSRAVTVGLDGSRESMAAAAWAADEARLRKLPLGLLHAWDLGPDVHTPLIGPDVRPHWAERMPRKAAERIHTTHPGLEVRTAHRCGEPATVLCRAAEDSELLVLGSRGLGGLAGAVVGSVALSVVARTRRPVVLVPVAEPEPARSGSGSGVSHGIVLGIDLARPCDEVLDFAFAHARRHGAALRVLHSWSPPPLHGVRPTAATPVVASGVTAAKEAALTEFLEPWRRKYSTIPVTVRCRAGRAAHDLVEAARAADLVVVGRRTRRSPVGSRIGSVVHAVLQHSPAPVAVIPHA